MSRAAKWESLNVSNILRFPRVAHRSRQLHVRKRLIRDFIQLQYARTMCVCVCVIKFLYSHSNVEQMGHRTNH
jgi:hypothetical protein